MSHQWAYSGLEKLSEQTMDDMKSQILNCPWFLCYDNVNIAFYAYSQWLNNQSHFDNECASTLFLIENPDPLVSLLSNAQLQETQKAGHGDMFDIKEVIQLENKSHDSSHAFFVYQVLHYLLDSSDFDLKTYHDQDSPLFKKPPAINQIPHDSSLLSKQFMLWTVHIEEASHEGNSQIMEEWFKQLGLDSLDKQQRSLTHFTKWIGVYSSLDGFI